ncbi:DUF4913 domain-containing protein [Streptomyces sp. 4N509B]|uniref:DUF4913 domain-containing protein n=1 Tax=Streptomyces sp. 4N509B TaxID=3457413 RepID=UPI003FCF1127
MSAEEPESWMPDPVRVPEQDLDDLAAHVAMLAARAQSHDQLLERLTSDTADSVTVEASPGSTFVVGLEGDAYQREVAALAQWVDEVLLPVYGREISTQAPWCPWWIEHPEAVARLHGLWLAWHQHIAPEAGPSGPAVWHRDHLDHVIAQLRAPGGPFSACTTSPKRLAHRLLAPPRSADEPPPSGPGRAAA